jgi:MFS family permease
LARIARQPVFIVAALSAALGYGIMNLLMTATPLAMSFCGHPFSAAAFVIEWHVVGMYAPGFFTGSLIKRFGTLKVIAVGIVLIGACVLVALSGVALWQFWAALVLLGVGWNFMYTGGTTLLIEAYKPAEKAKTQGMNDVLVFTVMSVSSFSSGALVSVAGWEWMNLGALPPLAIVAGAVLWLTLLRRQGPRVTGEAT